MKRSIKFENDWVGDWYAVIPEWDGPKSALQMVMGADTMLSIISGGDASVTLYLTIEPFEHACVLEFVRDGGDIGGGYYNMRKYNGIDFNLEMWLCDVTKFVFGDLPKFI